MKNIILRNVTIVDSNSPHNGKKLDILIVDGIIKKINNNIQFSEPFFEVKLKDLHVSTGWLDLHTRVGEPGFEQRETIETGLKTAAKGGFTGIVTMPSTSPPIDAKSDILFLIQKSENNIVNIYPTGCITKECKQTEITEMYDMFSNGAVAFTDDKKCIQNAMLMNTALEYVNNFNGLIMTTCLDGDLNKLGQINESIISTKMGLSPSPSIAENLMVSRDLEILKYTNSKLHISTISTSESVKRIKKAKNEKLRITTDVAAHQLILTDQLFTEYNSNLKVQPPIRDEKTRLSLIEGIINGTIDTVSSDHTPIEIDCKKCEFEKSEFGIIGLETVFPNKNTVLKNKLKLENIINLISINPRKILDLKIPKIEENEVANLTLFNPKVKWNYTEKEITSKSKNTPFINYEFIGKSVGIINNNQILIQS